MVLVVKRIYRVLIAVMVVCLLVGCHQESGQDIYEGMSMEEFQERIPEDRYFHYSSYIFTRNDDGDHIVARVSDDYTTITKVTCYEAENVDISDEAFLKIKEGMSVEQVVSMVGIPEGTYTSGMISLGFCSNTDAHYSVYFSPESAQKRTELFVTSVLPLDKAAIVTRALAEQVKVGMSYKEVYDLLGPTKYADSEAKVYEYGLSDGGTVYFTYSADAEGTLRVTDIRIVEPAQ